MSIVAPARIPNLVPRFARTRITMPRVCGVRPKYYLSVMALSVVGILAGSAYALANSSSEPPPSLKWNLPSSLGQPINAAGAIQTFAARSDVSPSSIRQIVASSSGLTLIVGQNSSDRPCTASAGTTVSNFNCLSDWSDKFAMLLYSTEGGSTLFAADHASLVGVARSDVVKVVLTTADGAESTLALNEAHGFSYDSSSASTLPESITAYDQDGQPLETEAIQVGSQSG
jgi:hypothetical protein